MDDLYAGVRRELERRDDGSGDMETYLAACEERDALEKARRAYWRGLGFSKTALGILVRRVADAESLLRMTPEEVWKLGGCGPAAFAAIAQFIEAREPGRVFRLDPSPPPPTNAQKVAMEQMATHLRKYGWTVTPPGVNGGERWT